MSVISERSQEVLSKGVTETLYLGTIRDNSVVFSMCWNVQLLLNNNEVSFKLDTGADNNGTAIPIHQKSLLTKTSETAKRAWYFYHKRTDPAHQTSMLFTI